MRKSIIIILASIIVFIISSMLYITYGYVTAEISGNEASKKITNLSQVLKVEYSGGTNELITEQDNYFVPGSTLTKTFSIKNVGNVDLDFSINLNNVTNEFTRPNDLIYELYLGDDLLISDIFPTEDATIAYNQSLNIGDTSTYTLKIMYLKSEENQIEDQGKIINASIDFEHYATSLSNIKILGNSIQDGIPSLTSPVEIQSVGEKSKNLFSFIENEKTYNNVNFLVKNQEVIITGSTTAPSESDVISAITFERITNYRIYASISANKSFLLEPGTYTLSADVHTTQYKNGVSLIVGDIGKSASSSENPAIVVDQNNTFTITEPKYCMPVYHKYKTNETTHISNIQLEKSSEASDFIPKAKYLLPVKIKSKNIANLESVNKFVKKMHFAKVDTTQVAIISDEKGRKILKIFSAAAYGNENYDVLKKIFEGIFEDNTQYTLSFDYYNSNDRFTTNIAVNYTDGSKAFISNNTSHLKYTTAKNKTVSSISINYNAGTTYIYLDTLQIEKGTEETAYEPYRGFNLYLDEPLRKVGDCSDFSCMDYIDLKEQKIVRNIHSEYITNVGNISEDSGSYKKFLSNIEYKPLLNGSGVNGKGYAISNKFVMSNVAYNELSSYPNLIQTYIDLNGANKIVYTFDDSSINTLPLGQAKIGDGFEVNYIMASPMYEDIETTNFYSINPASNINVSTSIPATVIKESNN